MAQKLLRQGRCCRSRGTGCPPPINSFRNTIGRTRRPLGQSYARRGRRQSGGSASAASAAIPAPTATATMLAMRYLIAPPLPIGRIVPALIAASQVARRAPRENATRVARVARGAPGSLVGTFEPTGWRRSSLHIAESESRAAVVTRCYERRFASRTSPLSGTASSAHWRWSSASQREAWHSPDLRSTLSWIPRPRWSSCGDFVESGLTPKQPTTLSAGHRRGSSWQCS